MKRRFALTCGCTGLGLGLAMLLVATLGPTGTVGAERVVICEEFTATWCSHCADIGPIYGQLMDNYPDTFAFVQIHHGDDYATTWGNQRANFYTDFGGYPTAYFDGGEIVAVGGSHNYSALEGYYNSRRADTPDVTIDAGGIPVGGQTYEFTAEICIEPAGTAKTMRIYMVQLLDDWPIPPTWSRTGFKQAAATEDVTLQPGECAIVTRQFTFDADSWANQDEIRIVVWAQEPQGTSPPGDRAVIHQGKILAWPFEPFGAPNDECNKATVVVNETVSASTEFATDDGSASCAAGAQDVWFSYRAPATGTLDVDTCGSDFDTVLSVHTGCPGAPGNELDCSDNDDFCGGGSAQSYLTMAVTEGEVLIFRLAGVGRSYGNYVITFDGPADITPPTPDPMSFISAPTALGMDSISMTAIEAADNGSPDIEYYFELVAGGAGGDDSGWQTSQDYLDDGLFPDTEYSYRVKARDGAENETGYSDPASARTHAERPAKPTITNITSTTLDIEVEPEGNPASTEFAINCPLANVDPDWNQMFVDAAGLPSVDPVWRTMADWGVPMTVQSLSPDTAYCWRVMARNGDGIETEYSVWSCAQTGSGLIGDLNCDGEVDFGDINAFVLRLSDPAGYLAQYPDCPDANGDINEDGEVDFGDINAFVSLLSG